MSEPATTVPISSESVSPELAASLARLQAASDEAGSGTPKAVLAAFVPLSTSVNGIVLPRIDMGKVLILEQLDSPYISSTRKTATLRDVAAALLVLSQPDNDITRSVIARGEFEAAVDAWSDTLPPGTLKGAGTMIFAHIDQGFATSVPYGKEGGAVPLSQHPGAEAASGGSSPSPTP